MTARADELFELTEALLCTEGPVRTLVELALAPEHRRGHGALYDALNHGRIEVARLRWALAGLALPRARDGRIVLGVDVSPWLRPDAPTSAQRLFCHTYGRGRGQAQMIPGWPYSIIATLEPWRTSWTGVLDVVRLGPDAEVTDVTAAQVRELVERLREAGQHHDGDPDILVVVDAGYDVCRLAFPLVDLPVEVLGRIRSDRVLCFPAAARAPDTVGRPPRHGAAFALARAQDGPPPGLSTTTDTTRYGTAPAQAWDRLHPRLTHRGAWADHEGDLPTVEGTVIWLQVARLPGHQDPKTPVAVVVQDQPHPGRCRPLLAGVPAPVRSGTHLPAVQADPRLDRPEGPRSRRRGSLDLADHHRLHPAPPGPRLHR